jgi:pimeloyl-ACP methyl ester carboxylesterase
MNTFFIGDEQNPKLVMLPGYGGTGLIFYKLFKELSKKFYLIVVDIIGQGSSSMPKVKFQNWTDCDEFFLSRL